MKFCKNHSVEIRGDRVVISVDQEAPKGRIGHLEPKIVELDCAHMNLAAIGRVLIAIAQGEVQPWPEEDVRQLAFESVRQVETVTCVLECLGEDPSAGSPSGIRFTGLADGSEEAQAYFEATPFVEMRMDVVNELARDRLLAGHKYECHLIDRGPIYEERVGDGSTDAHEPSDEIPGPDKHEGRVEVSQELIDLPHIGEVRGAKLALAGYNSLDAIVGIEMAELVQVAGISDDQAIEVIHAAVEANAEAEAEEGAAASENHEPSGE